MTALADTHAAVVAQISAALPDLGACAAHAGRFDLREIRALSTRTPAVHVTIVGGRQGRGHASSPVIDLQMAAYVVTKDAMGLPREAGATAICQTLLVEIPERRWGVPAAGAAQGVAMQNLNTKETREAGVSLWAVTWTQPVAVLPDTPEAEVEIEIRAGQAPEIGADHADGYSTIGGET